MAKGPKKSLGERRPDILRRFRSFIEPGANGCELWTGYSRLGVPRFYCNGHRPARAVALLLAGRHRTSMVRRLTTSCGDARCVATDHAISVPKAPAIPKHKRRVLTPAQREEIRFMRYAGAKLAEIARKFRINVSTVCSIAPPRRNREAAA
jgi:hypothetical protein